MSTNYMWKDPETYAKIIMGTQIGIKIDNSLVLML